MVVKVIRKCVTCSRSLENRRTKFCSDRCSDRHKANREKRLKVLNLLPKIVCKGCGETFQPVTTRQVCCHPNCWNIMYKATRAKNYLANKSEPKKRKSDRFKDVLTMPSMKLASKEVASVEFTTATTPEREELQKQVEEYIKSGGKIVRYRQQADIIGSQHEIEWNIPEADRNKLSEELYRLWGGTDVLYGN